MSGCASVASTSVYCLVKQLMRERWRRAAEVFVPLHFEPGDVAEVDSFEVVVHADEPGDAQVVEDLHAEGVGDEPRYRLKAFSGVVPDTVSATPGRLPNAAIVVSLSPLLECAGMNGSGTAFCCLLTNDWREGVVFDALAEALTATLAGQSLSSSSSSP